MLEEADDPGVDLVMAADNSKVALSLDSYLEMVKGRREAREVNFKRNLCEKVIVIYLIESHRI